MTLAPTTENINGKAERDRLAEGEAILSDRANGMSSSALMEKYGISKATLSRRIHQALDARLAVTVDQYREEQNALLDEQMQRLQRHMAAAATMIELGNNTGDAALIDRGLQHHLKTIEALNRTMERRARLNGLDAPVKVDAQVTVTTPVDAAVDDLARQLQGA